LAPRVPRLLVPAAVLVASLSLGAGTARRVAIRVVEPAGPAASMPEAALPSPACPPRALPDGTVCVRAPEADESAPEAEDTPNAHHDPRGRWVTYDEIPRRPERPEDYDAYRYPVPCDRDCVTSGYDLDRPDEQQRRLQPRHGAAAETDGARNGIIGHGAVDLLQPRGTPIAQLRLAHQEGDAEVVFVGTLFGLTLVTRHAVREGDRVHDYLLLLGHLDAAAPGLSPGVAVKEGEVVGQVGDSGSPGAIHLHVEVRRLRAGVDPSHLSPAALVANETSMVCDPRNVLPLRRGD
jgi:murein DD-endopeptidase MepM/ murein hydrolase activator NlpD